MSYLYGPVPSRRLGFSLGVDLIPKKTCTLNCLYCQLGYGRAKGVKRKFYVDMSELTKELREAIKYKPEIDYISICGSGEPTLHKDLDKIIRSIRRTTKNKYPICVITNSSLLYREDVRRELRLADLIIPSLDAAFSSTFRRINRPHKDIAFKKMVDGIIKLRKEFKGKFWLEIMLLAGVNDTVREIEGFKKIVDKIKPDKVQLNVPVRPTDAKIFSPSAKKIKAIEKMINYDAKAVKESKKIKTKKVVSRDIEKKILNFLKRRPATLDDLVSILGLKPKDVNRKLNVFLEENLLRKNNKYFVIND